MDSDLWTRVGKCRLGASGELMQKLFSGLCSLPTPWLGMGRSEGKKASQDSAVPAASAPKHLHLVCLPPSTTDEFIFKAKNS